DLHRRAYWSDGDSCLVFASNVPAGSFWNGGTWLCCCRTRNAEASHPRTFWPVQFGTAALGSAAAALELLGHRIPALNFIGFYAAAIETVLLIWLNVDKHGAADVAVQERG